MSTNEIVGAVFLIGIPLLVSIIAIIKPIINLNNSITKLNITIDLLIDENGSIKSDLREHEELLNDHEKRLYLIEHIRGENDED